MHDKYISVEAFTASVRERYCKSCDRRKGMKNGKLKTIYAIGDAPCRACGIDDMIDDVDDYPPADVRPVVRGRWEPGETIFFCGVEHTAPRTCSVCGRSAMNEPWYFCPNCGADMREVDDGK